MISPHTPKVYIILVNFNGWKYTLKCIESLLQITDCEFQITVCDNHSTDDSLTHIQSCLSNIFKIAAQEPINLKTNLKFSSRVESALMLESSIPVKSIDGWIKRQLLLIRTKDNLGFAGGNNVGILFALAAGDFDYVWLLNNDTVVKPQALSALVERMKAVPEAGMCGSTILYQDDPQIIQSLGGARYLKWTGVGVQLGANERWPIDVRAESVEKEMNYVSGASMLVSKRFLETVGLMEESYFLYFEEIDWAQRAAGRFNLTYAPNSIVYHKEGGTIGSSQSGKFRSPKSFYWLTRSRLRFTLKYYPEAFPSVLLYSLINCTQLAFFNRNPHIFMAGIKACAHAGLTIDRSRLTR
jgi:GT2 family glycosyltransferase